MAAHPEIANAWQDGGGYGRYHKDSCITYDITTRQICVYALPTVPETSAHATDRVKRYGHVQGVAGNMPQGGHLARAGKQRSGGWMWELVS